MNEQTVVPCRLSKNEIEYVIQSPFSMLSRREMLIRKLLTKFHDDPAKVSGTNALSAAAFDPHRAERTRAKNPRTYTKEEKEWVSIDQHLHPEVHYAVTDLLSVIHLTCFCCVCRLCV